MNKLEQKEGRLHKEVNGTVLGIEKAFNTCIMITKPNGEMSVMQLSTEDVDQLAYWLFENFNLALIPGYRDLAEHRKAIEQRDDYKKMSADYLEKMFQYTQLIKRLGGTMKTVIESYGEHLLPDAIKQMADLVAEADDIAGDD